MLNQLIQSKRPLLIVSGVSVEELVTAVEKLENKCSRLAIQYRGEECK